MNSHIETSRQSKPFKRVWITLAAILLVALVSFLLLRLLAEPQPDDLAYEAAKISLQVIGVTLISGAVTAAISSAQQARQEELAAEADRSRRDAEALERQRENFEVRASLLDRAVRCAQAMFITCQHVRRVKADAVGRAAPCKAAEDGRDLLDRAYLQFSTEAAAIQTELGARFQEKRNEGDAAGEAFLRWHQMEDLLTVYYYDLCGRFRGEVLARNSKGHDGEGKKCEDDSGWLHSGIDFTPVVSDPDRPKTDELKEVRRLLRKEFWETMPKFAAAVLKDEIRDL
ncbi:hypothetical protein ACFYE2_03735 [Kocuria sp. CPCC 205300]|uniref:hypothetical protein n=1 Tax=Kocuria sabuli TaxID=3071448 RepID=UPI0036DE5643